MASATHVSVADPDSDARPSEIDRLERAVRCLIEERAVLLIENESMRGELEAMRALQEKLLAESQLRHDALKRIDDLVGLIEQLDPSLAAMQGTKSAKDAR
jgi:regulator of replication initiation timing